MKDAKKDKINIHNSTRTIIISMVTVIIILILIIVTSGFWISSWETYRKTQIICGSMALVFGSAVLFRIVKFFRVIDLVDQNAQLLSKGKLNISDILVKKAKGLEALCIAFNDMKTNLLSFTELTKLNIVTISDAIDTVSKSVKSSYQSNEQIASSMGDIAKESQKQLKNLNNTLESIYNVDSKLSSIEQNIGNIENLVNFVVDSTGKGNNNLDEYNQQLNVITDNLINTTSFINNLNNELKEIYQLGSLIIDISDKLRLLAFNASIESAKAGESGRGFSVVASQMTKMSTETRNSITKINSLLKNVSDSGDNVKSSISKCVESYNVSRELFSSIKESFDTIKNNADILSYEIKKVYSEASVISNRTHDAKQKGQNLLDASNKISAETHEVAAVTQQELASTELIDSNIVSLKKMLQGIENLMKRFKTAVTPVDEVSKKTLNIAFISPMDHEFWLGVKRGVTFAGKELSDRNAFVEYIGFNPSNNDMLVNAINESINKGVDGIVVPGFIDGLAPLIEKAYQKNIPVMIFNCNLSLPSKKLAYFGPNVNEAGILAAEFMAEAINGKGNVALFRGPLVDLVHEARTEKIKEGLKKKRKVKLAYEIEFINKSEVLYEAVKKLLSQDKNIDGIITTGGDVFMVANAIREFNLVGKTKIVCFDFDKTYYPLIEEGIIYAAIGQDPFGQGHDPIIYLYNYLVTKEMPESEFIWTRTDVITQQNVKDLIY